MFETGLSSAWEQGLGFKALARAAAAFPGPAAQIKAPSCSEKVRAKITSERTLFGGWAYAEGDVQALIPSRALLAHTSAPGPEPYCLHGRTGARQQACRGPPHGTQTPPAQTRLLATQSASAAHAPMTRWPKALSRRACAAGSADVGWGGRARAAAMQMGTTEAPARGERPGSHLPPAIGLAGKGRGALGPARAPVSDWRAGPPRGARQNPPGQQPVPTFTGRLAFTAARVATQGLRPVPRQAGEIGAAAPQAPRPAAREAARPVQLAAAGGVLPAQGQRGRKGGGVGGGGGREGEERQHAERDGGWRAVAPEGGHFSQGAREIVHLHLIKSGPKAGRGGPKARENGETETLFRLDQGPPDITVDPSVLPVSHVPQHVLSSRPRGRAAGGRVAGRRRAAPRGGPQRRPQRAHPDHPRQAEDPPGACHLGLARMNLPGPAAAGPGPARRGAAPAFRSAASGLRPAVRAGARHSTLGRSCPPAAKPQPPMPLAGFSNIDFFTDVVRGYGVPYTVVRWDSAASPRQNLTELLWAPDGSAKFGAYLMYPNLEAIGAMNRVGPRLGPGPGPGPGLGHCAGQRGAGHSCLGMRPDDCRRMWCACRQA